MARVLRRCVGVTAIRECYPLYCLEVGRSVVGFAWPGLAWPRLASPGLAWSGPGWRRGAGCLLAWAGTAHWLLPSDPPRAIAGARGGGGHLA